jgi:hypothetical protein
MKNTYKEAVLVLQKYLVPACRQQGDELVASMILTVTALSELAKSCEFGELASEIIRDLIVENATQRN